MLTVSPAASAAISKALEGTEVPAGAGIRLSAGEPTARGRAISVAFVAAPDPADEVIDTGAVADVFVDQEAAPLLDDQVLDADIGPDGGISFSLHGQSAGSDGASPAAG